MERLMLAGFGIVFSLFMIAGILQGPWADIRFVIVLIVGGLGCCMVAGAILDRNVVWIISRSGILIDEQRPFGRLHSRMIHAGEILEMHLRKESDTRLEFSLAFKIRPQEELTSPLLPDITQVHSTAAHVAWPLRLPVPESADNPLDAANSEMRLGKPVEYRQGTENRILIVLTASMLSLPFVYALWNDKLSAVGAAVWSLVVVGAILFFRYAHRISGTLWIVRDGEIRVERRALNGTPDMQTIGGGDVATINVEPGNSDDGKYVIAIRLRNGKKVRSADIEGKDQAEALRTEIMRRLNFSGVETPTR